MSAFTQADHARLATLFDPDTPYAGYRPAVVEAPNGDTKACDACAERRHLTVWNDVPCAACNGTGRVPNVDAGRAQKRFLHVALKYDPPAWAVEYLARAHWEACRVATALDVPAAYRPHEADGTLRVLEYPSAGHDTDPPFHDRPCKACGVRAGRTGSADLCPALAPGAGTAEHTDFDLFSIVLWRSHPADLERPGLSADRHAKDCPQYDDSGHLHHLAAAGIPCRCAWGLSPGLHIGEIGELVGLGPATPHRVPARPYVQRSIVYFAMPDHTEELPQAYSPRAKSGVLTVGEWLAERIARSRVYA